ncbi:hypothetical protein ABK932_26905, partial [Klebsiella aerogenes]
LAHTAEQRGLRFLPLQPAAGIKNALCRQRFAGDSDRFPRQRVSSTVCLIYYYEFCRSIFWEKPVSTIRNIFIRVTFHV